MIKPFGDYGYKMKKNSFWKVEDGFFKLIDFQKGAYGADYFFVNVCLHPIGLPMLTTKELTIIENPNEHECIIRQRIEAIVSNPDVNAFNKKLVSTKNSLVIKGIVNSINEIEQWFKKWGTFDAVEKAEFDEISNMLTVVPILKKKAFLLLKCYCYHQEGNNESAKILYNEYLQVIVDDLKFQNVDIYIGDLINSDE
jgi:hypothetical protein